ncbi:MAG: hypothetical protein V1755_09065 [Chloroflexota bacterium]
MLRVIRVCGVALIVDLQSEAVRRDQAHSIIGEARGFLHPLTSVSLLMTDFVEDAGGGSTHDMASRYITSHAGALPNGLEIFSLGHLYASIHPDVFPLQHDRA